MKPQWLISVVRFILLLNELPSKQGRIEKPDYIDQEILPSTKLHKLDQGHSQLKDSDATEILPCVQCAPLTRSG